MKLSEIREAYEDVSRTLSKINRQLAFAGIGIVWLFRITDKTGNTTIDSGMLIPLLCFAVSFACDLLQYLYLSIAWYFYYWRKHSNGVAEDAEVHEPECVNIPAWILLVVKVIIMMFAYGYLGFYLCYKLISWQ
jgi:hypothetical protein